VTIIFIAFMLCGLESFIISLKLQCMKLNRAFITNDSGMRLYDEHQLSSTSLHMQKSLGSIPSVGNIRFPLYCTTQKTVNGS
jgi:hypothetical protein